MRLRGPRHIKKISPTQYTTTYLSISYLLIRPGCVFSNPGLFSFDETMHIFRFLFLTDRRDTRPGLLFLFCISGCLSYCCLFISLRQFDYSLLMSDISSTRHFLPKNCHSLDIFLYRSIVCSLDTFV